MLRASRVLFAAMGSVIAIVSAVSLQAQQPPASVEMTAAERQFQESMSNVTLTGFFTVGDGSATMPDKYTIGTITKVGADLWSLEASIQYGNKSYKATIKVPVLWAGETPVLTLANYLIPGQGIYSARILIHNDMYAGTWGASAKGGMMFGRIVKNVP